MASLSERRGTNCTDAEWDEILEMKNDLLPYNSKKYLEARKLITYWSEVNGFYKSYAPEIGIAICFSCNQLVYTGKRTKNIGNYNHIGMEKHWASHCAGNKYCGVSYGEYQKIIQKTKSARKYDDNYALRRYELWTTNAIRRIKRAREVGKKIKACIKIKRKVVEWIYRPDGLTATELALHYACLQNIRAEMHQCQKYLWISSDFCKDINLASSANVYSEKRDSSSILAQSMFHPDYNPIIAKLPKSLVKRAYHRLLYHSRSPVIPERISEKCDRIENYLYHTLEVYEKGLNRKRKKQIQIIEPLENLSHNNKASVKTYIDMTNQETQTQNINPICTCNHEEEINRRVKKELDILCRRLLEYNEETFGKFMREIIIEHVDRIKANKKLRCEVEENRIARS
nr:8667_t:CDS:2 [Entrophospora candida]